MAVGAADPCGRDVALAVAEAIHLALRKSIPDREFLEGDGKEFVTAAWAAIFTYVFESNAAETRKRFARMISIAARQGGFDPGNGHTVPARFQKSGTEETKSPPT